MTGWNTTSFMQATKPAAAMPTGSAPAKALPPSSNALLKPLGKAPAKANGKAAAAAPTKAGTQLKITSSSLQNTFKKHKDDEDDDEEDEDDEGEEQMQTLQTRKLANYSLDMTADSESVRMRSDLTSSVTDTAIEPRIGEGVKDATYKFRDKTVNKFATASGNQIVHQGVYEADATLINASISNFTSKNPRAKNAWLDALIEKDGAKVAGSLQIRKITWDNDPAHITSCMGCVRVEIANDEPGEQKAYDTIIEKSGLKEDDHVMVHFEERQVERLYAIPNNNLPTMYNPRNSGIKYRTVNSCSAQAIIDAGWEMIVVPPKGGARARKAPADKAEGAKKQKTANSMGFKQATLIAPAQQATTDDEEGTATTNTTFNSNSAAASSSSNREIIIWTDHGTDTRMGTLKNTATVHYSCVQNPNGWNIIETTL